MKLLKKVSAVALVASLLSGVGLQAMGSLKRPTLSGQTRNLLGTEGAGQQRLIGGNGTMKPRVDRQEALVGSEPMSYRPQADWNWKKKATTNYRNGAKYKPMPTLNR